MSSHGVTCGYTFRNPSTLTYTQLHVHTDVHKIMYMTGGQTY